METSSVGWREFYYIIGLLEEKTALSKESKEFTRESKL